MRPGRPLPEVSIAPSWQAAAAVRGHDHVAGRRAGRQRPAERAERRLDERVGVEVAEGHAVLALGVLGLDADREQRDDPRARVSGREGVDLLLDLVVVDVARIVPPPAQRLADAVEVHEHGDLAGRSALQRVRHDRDRAAVGAPRPCPPCPRRPCRASARPPGLRPVAAGCPACPPAGSGRRRRRGRTRTCRSCRSTPPAGWGRRRSARRPGSATFAPAGSGSAGSETPSGGSFGARCSARTTAWLPAPRCRARMPAGGCRVSAGAGLGDVEPARLVRALAAPAGSLPDGTGVLGALRIFR